MSTTPLILSLTDDLLRGLKYQDKIARRNHLRAVEADPEQFIEEQIADRTVEILNHRMPEVFDSIWSDGELEKEYYAINQQWMKSVKNKQPGGAFKIEQFLYRVAEVIANKETEND